MFIASLVLAALAALVHVYIFVLESLRWTAPTTRATFGTTADTAEITKPLAFNQGFYNLFLAIIAVVGILAVGTPFGIALVVASSGSMVAAALVLVLSDRTKLRAGLVQGAAPVLALIALLIATV